jgi:glycosyltransferase involved in cell wall biosynthesis
MNTLIIPAFNEEESIESVVLDASTVLNKKSLIPFEIIVVDDGSTDKTPLILNSLKEKVPNLVVFTHPRQCGVGAARCTGVFNAKGEKIAFVDADTTYDVKDLEPIFLGLKEYDMVVGARRDEKGTLKPIRFFIKYVFKTLASLLTRSNIEDLNSGIRGMDKKKVFEFLHLLPSGHSWVSTITLCFLASGYTVSYIPTNYFKRTGHSTFKIFEDTHAMFMTIIKTIVYFYPMRVILPISYAFFVIGTLFFIRDILQHDVADTTILFLVIGIILFIFSLMSEQLACLRREINRKNN